MESKRGEEGRYLQSNNSLAHALRKTLTLRGSPTSNSVEKVILGVDTNRKGVRGRGEELLSVRDQQIYQTEAGIPIEPEYNLLQRQCSTI